MFLINHGTYFLMQYQYGLFALSFAQNPRNSRRLPLVCPPGLDYSLLANNKTGKETKEHTMEELVEFSRVAMEQLHKKLELQRKQLLLLSEGSSTNQRSGASLPVKESPVSAIAAQGLMHTIPQVGTSMETHSLMLLYIPAWLLLLKRPASKHKQPCLAPRHFPLLCQ